MTVGHQHKVLPLPCNIRAYAASTSFWCLPPACICAISPLWHVEQHCMQRQGRPLQLVMSVCLPRQADSVSLAADARAGRCIQSLGC